MHICHHCHNGNADSFSLLMMLKSVHNYASNQMETGFDYEAIRGTQSAIELLKQAPPDRNMQLCADIYHAALSVTVEHPDKILAWEETRDGRRKALTRGELRYSSELYSLLIFSSEDSNNGSVTIKVAPTTIADDGYSVHERALFELVMQTGEKVAEELTADFHTLKEAITDHDSNPSPLTTIIRDISLSKIINYTYLLDGVPVTFSFRPRHASEPISAEEVLAMIDTAEFLIPQPSFSAERTPHAINRLN
jgi:hypothetical protein